MGVAETGMGGYCAHSGFVSKLRAHSLGNSNTVKSVENITVLNVYTPKI